MTDQTPVSHPPVSHPQAEATAPVPGPVPTVPAPPTTAAEKPARKRAKTAAKRKLPPPEVVAAVVLLVVALELLIWQVGGPRWGVPIHTILALLILIGVVVVLVNRRLRARQEAQGGKRATAARSGETRQNGTRIADMLRRRLGSTGGARSGPSGSSSTGGTRGRIGRALAGLRGGRPGGTATAGRSGRASRTSGTGGRSGRLRTAGRSALAGLGLGGTSRRPAAKAGRSGSGTTTSGSRPGGRLRAALGGRTAKGGAQGRKPATGAGAKSGKAKPGAWAAFKEGWNAAGKDDKAKDAKKATDQAEPKKADKPATTKPQQPTKEQLVKDAVKRAADATPAPIPHTRKGGTPAMGDMNKVRSAADELAAALKDYDPEDMHQFVREMPGLADALNAISGGLRHVASRAESEWPLAGPAVEGIRTMANDIKAAAGTAEETRGTVHRENEADIERGVAPRHGSLRAESRWNVNGNS